MDWQFAGFVFFSTLCSYSFHWYLTDHTAGPSHRLDWLKKNRFIHTTLFFTGIAGSIFYFYYLLPHWHWLLISAMVTFLYSAPKVPHKYFKALRKVALGKTIFLAFVWTYVTTILPIITTNEPWNTGFLLFTISRFFLVYAICILFDYRDRDYDKAEGIRSLITNLDDKSITLIFIIALLVSTLCCLLLLKDQYSLAAVCLLLIPRIVTASLYNTARKNFSDMLYYFLLDGLMAFSALLMLIAGI